MPYNFTFYVHHHGAGHMTRSMAIAKQLIRQSNCTVTLLGTGLSHYSGYLPTNLTIVELPADTPSEDDTHYAPQSLEHLHYAPRNVSGLLHRNVRLLNHFQQHPQTICVVDVSCEIAQLACLCGIPTVLIRQHGNRQDLAHRLAYDSAALIIAPYGKNMSTDAEEGRYTNKTLFSGGFSRFTERKVAEPANKNHIALFVGKGGTALNDDFIKHLCKQLPERYVLHVLGDVHVEKSESNLIVHGHLQNPTSIIDQCSLVFCNAGHNTVMEMASLRKRIVCIPAARPFDEQIVKAAHLARLGLAVVVSEEQLFHVNWHDTVARAEKLDTSLWAAILDDQALPNISRGLHEVYDSFFSKQSLNEEQSKQRYA